MSHDETAVEAKTVFGFWLYLLSDVLLFASFFATYAVLLKGTAGNVGAGALVPLPKVLLETFVLLFSSFTCGLSQTRALGEGQRGIRPVGWLGLTLGLGAVFFFLVLSDLASLLYSGHGWEKSGFLSAYFTLVGIFLAHILAGLFWMVVLLILLWRRGVTPNTHRKIVCFKLFWHFLNIIWVGIFSWVYLLGAI